MHNVDIRNISLGQIQYFVKAAEYGNITKAAMYFNLTQPTLSKKLMSMESQLDLQLFVREKKSVKLTPAGRHLYKCWRQMIAGLEEQVQYAHVIQQGYRKQVVIAILDSFRPEPFLLPAVEEFRKRHPDVLLRMESDSAQDIRRMLIAGDVDVIFSVFYDFREKDKDRIAWTRFGSCCHSVCMRKTNPLADRKMLKVEDLKQSDFICISPLQLPEYVKELHRVCSRAGFAPNITNYVTSANSLTLNLLTDRDIFLCDRYYFDLKSEDHCMIPLEDTESGVVMAWRKNTDNSCADQFVGEALELFRQRGM